RDLMYTRVPALIVGQIDENWLNSRAMEFENVSRRLNAYAAAAEVDTEVDTLSITKDGVELRGAKALQATTDSLFQAIKNGADHTTAAIAFLADSEFNRYCPHRERGHRDRQDKATGALQDIQVQLAQALDSPKPYKRVSLVELQHPQI